MLCSFISFLCNVTTISAAQSIPLLAKKVKPAIVSIEIYDSQKAPIGSATGFIMNPAGHILTNWPLVSERFRAKCP